MNEEDLEIIRRLIEDMELDVSVADFVAGIEKANREEVEELYHE